MTSLARLGKRLRTPMAGCGTWYSETAKAHPAATGIVTTLLKTSAADLFAQKVLERKDQIDWRRNGMFCTFGFAYLGCWQFYLYNRVFVSLAPQISSAMGKAGTVAVLTFIDQCIHHPFLYFPAFYLVKGGMEGTPARTSLSKCWRELGENCKALWLIWVPAQLVNFSIVPLHLRIPFVAGVSFAWTIILSALRGAMERPVVDLATVPGTEAVTAHVCSASAAIAL